MDEYKELGMDIPVKRDDETEEEFSRRLTEVLLSEWTVRETSEDRDYEELGMDISSKQDDESDEEYSRHITEVLLSEWTVGGTSEDDEHRGRGRRRETEREARVDSPGSPRLNETQGEYANRVIGSLPSELRGCLPPSPPRREPKPQGREERPSNCEPADF
ncbi:hypothetical protein HYFRA_00005536 [Hymenoscyphus fraxineus]|uniref:Uncharacterized protein n=1 Tax=Hymenoscyphus fraxineus TaxID=746836 RepID=A0A9N9KTA9_9HELO|nr:hypothetical protein HYFRA_00005536 [Hymenoscyphus fraxineus]